MRSVQKVVLFALLFGGIISWRFGWGNPDQASWFHATLGYYWMWVLFAYLIYVAVDVAKLENIWARCKNQLPKQKGTLLVILACSGFFHAHEPHEFRVLYDEPSHLQLSQMMLFERQAMIASRTHYIGDHLIFLNPTPSFRQYFFSFLLTICHAIFGYSPNAPFVLNAFLGLALLIAAYASAHIIVNRQAGIIVVLLLTALPLLAQNVTSGGYDVLNLCFLASLPAVAMCYIRSTPDSAGKWLNLMVALAWGASQVRYESLLYFGAIATLVGLRWLWSRDIIITWPLCLAPVMLAPSFAGNMILMKTPAALLPGLRAANEPFMGIQYFWSNFQDLLVSLYSFGDKGLGSVLVAVAGSIGCAAIVAYFASKRDFTSETAKPLVVFAALFASVVVAYVPALLNFWGSPLDGQAARFTLPIWLYLALAGSWIISRAIKRSDVLGYVTIASIVGVILSVTAEASASHSTTDLLVPARVERWFLDFAKRQDRPSTLFVSKSNVELMTYGYAAVRLDSVNASPDKCVRILQSGVYNNIYILERSEFPPSNEVRHRDLALVGSHLLVEEVAVRSFGPGQRTRILKFLGYRAADGTAVTPASASPLPPQFETDAKRSEYLFSLYP